MSKGLHFYGHSEEPPRLKSRKAVKATVTIKCKFVILKK